MSEPPAWRVAVLGLDGAFKTSLCRALSACQRAAADRAPLATSAALLSSASVVPFVEYDALPRTSLHELARRAESPDVGSPLPAALATPRHANEAVAIAVRSAAALSSPVATPSYAADAASVADAEARSASPVATSAVDVAGSAKAHRLIDTSGSPALRGAWLPVLNGISAASSSAREATPVETRDLARAAAACDGMIFCVDAADETRLAFARVELVQIVRKWMALVGRAATAQPRRVLVAVVADGADAQARASAMAIGRRCVAALDGVMETPPQGTRDSVVVGLAATGELDVASVARWLLDRF
jgi:hypothetical protein